ncbi:ExeM/NucH family extracellular endonuclease [Pseudoduganella lutea]|uniref:ExeM/NucH family extracellular endonuclease n=1 Tax=Pseudoduganella lutea TaxID=321985 RepID=A0A4P6KWF2_9BURK|nr:ExeM/NucH family extracellular endonuclease [Pseudoduganella lutea]QBE62508.1 ExeM/NucH family extracellular endonuclease [Pseudoduganella lutea]
MTPHAPILGRKTALAAALAAALATPAFAASDIVISQVYGGGGNSGATLKSDFIELFNRSDAAVTLSDWSVQYASAGGGTWQVTRLPAVTIAPGKYYLVQQATGTGGSVALEPDTTGTIAMSGSGGKVALVSSITALAGATPSGGALVDLVGWGSAGHFEGAAPAGGTGNATAVLRNEAGCIDTDNNGADFTVATPAPRNAAAPAHSCNVPVNKPIVLQCPASLGIAQGYAGITSLRASDADSIVNAAAITSAAVPGITLAFDAATVDGGSAAGRLEVAANVPLGDFPVTIRFANDDAQDASCTVNVAVRTLAAITHTIPEIQGSGATSPYANSVQTTEGIVTAKVAGGFFLQDANGDGDPVTSDGLYVYNAAAAEGVAVGQRVRVTGKITEYTPNGASRSYTEMTDVTFAPVLSSGHSVAPTNVALPNARLDQVEGMLVRFTNPLTISQTDYLGSRGELSLSSGRLEIPTNRYAPRSAEAAALAASNAANLIVLDDGIFTTPTTIPYIGEGRTVRAGDLVHDLTGVVDYGALGAGGAGFKLQPTVAPAITRDNPRDGAPALPAGNVKVASANVLNFFTTFTDGTTATGQTNQGCTVGSSTTRGNCRGADNLAEYVRQRDKIVNQLKNVDADVVGLMEIQNNGDTAVGLLVESLNAAYGAPVYAVVPKPAATGTDAIRVAMIYKPAAVTLVGGALADANSVNNRPPMAQTFRAANGEKFSVVVNHLKSKGSCPSGTGPEADNGDGQSCWNATRVAQAQQLVNTFVPQVQAAAGDNDVLLIGDFNAYGMEDPIAAITARGYVNQLERFVRPVELPYSYVFGHQAGYLDHALASASLSPQVVGAAEWHANADEPEVIDYNTNGKPQDLYDAQPYRASDHDPVVISLALQPAYSEVTASVQVNATGLGFNRVTQLFTGSVTLVNRSSAALAGPLSLRFDGLPAGITVVNATGMHDGAPYIRVAGGLAPGASVTLPLTLRNPAKVNATYTAKIFSGNF